MSDNPIPINVSFEDAKPEIWESDLLLLRTRSVRFSRVMKAAWWNDEVFAIEVRKFEGVVIVPLEQLVRQHPGKIDVYEVNPQDQWKNYDRSGTNKYLMNMQFSKEDRRSAILETLLNLFFRWFNVTNKKIGKTMRDAEAIRMADRLGGGVEPLPDMVNSRITPSDLKESPLYRYRFTLR